MNNQQNMIEYLTHQILTNKNSQTEMYYQLKKVETPLNQTSHNQTT